MCRTVDPLHKKTVRVWNTHGSSPLLLFFLGTQQRRADDACVSCKAGGHNTRLLCAAARIAVFSHVARTGAITASPSRLMPPPTHSTSGWKILTMLVMPTHR